MRSTIEREEQQTDTEFTLGMASLLGIFFGLVLVCGVFFGFGYSLGRGNSSSQPSASALSSQPAFEPQAGSGAAKPSAQQSLAAEDSANDSSLNNAPEDDSQQEENSAAPATAATQPRATIKTVSAETGQPLASSAEPHTPASASRPVTPELRTATSQQIVPAGGGIMVQVAAVSHQEDADVLVSALRKRGYSVVVRNDSTDKLLHIQTGPFSSREEANAMRTRLSSDGYNAILKQ